MRFALHALRLLAIVFALACTTAVAQEFLDDPVAAAEATVAEIDRLSERLDTVREDEQALAAFNAELLALQDQLVDEGVAITPRLSSIRQRLQQLGAPPEDGTESELVAEERENLSTERAQLNQAIALLEEKSVEAARLREEIASARRTLFANQLSRRSDLDAAFGREVLTDFADRRRALTRRISSWWQFTWRTKSSAFLSGLAIIAVLGTVIFALGARFLRPLTQRDRHAEEPSYFHRLTTAFWYTVLPTLALWLFLFIILAVLYGSNVLRDDITELLASLLVAIAGFALVFRLSNAVFAPELPNWRIVPMSDRMAGRLRMIFIIMALVSLSDILIVQINSIVGTSVSVSIVRSFMTAVIIGLLLLAVSILRPFQKQTEQGVENVGWPLTVKLLVAAMGAILVIAAAAGYVGFAHFVAQKIVVVGTTLATMYLGYLAARAIAEEGAFANSQIGGAFARRFNLSEIAADQFGLLLGFLLGAIVVSAGLAFLALVWGFDGTAIFRFLRRALTDIPVGNISISVSGIFTGILLFLFAYWLTRRFQSWIDGAVLERTRVEVGARNSIRTAIGYLGIAIAALIGASAAGFNMSQLALVAGALSLGIGFGLQNIVNNFVSGLILLFERPFKAGDIIEAGGFTGIVKTINVRATEVELFDRKTVILPNSELINSAVSNWMHRNTLTRLEIPVGVAYDSDPRQIEEILLEVATDHPRILSNPEPFVAFVDFGASSLDFILYAYLADLSFSIPTRSELRFEIFERFRVLGVEIPFPQSDVHLNVKQADQKEKPTGGADAETSFGVIKTGKTKFADDDE